MDINSFLYNHFDNIMGFIGIVPTICTLTTKIIEHKTKDESHNNKKLKDGKNGSIIVYVITLAITLCIWFWLVNKKSTLVSMPKVQGMTYGNAVQTLNENKIKFEDVNINDPNEWIVIKQSIDPDEVVDADEIVTLELERRKSINNDINLGDINNDCEIDITDARIIRRMFEGGDIISDFTIEQIIAADINHDNQITYIDSEITQGYYTYLMATSSMATSDKEIMSIEEYYVNKFDESEYSDN